MIREKQIVSKKRIQDYGEVFTGRREVNAMLDLVKQETERIDSRFLEPACGRGNFLADILFRKLNVVELRYRKSQLEYERNSFTAASSIYGIDLLEDNIVECRKRLLNILNERYASLYKNKTRQEFRKAVKYVLDRNILLGDALSLETVGKNPVPIVFSEWSFVKGSMLQRRDFIFKKLFPGEGLWEKTSFSDLGKSSFIPEPIKSYPLTHFLKVANVT